MSSGGDDDAARTRSRREEHGRDEQESAAEEHGGEEPVFAVPIRSRTAPTNHQNAMPAKGTRFNAATAVRRLESFVSQSPASPGLVTRNAAMDRAR